MPIDTGARRHGRAVSRIGPRPRAEGRTPAARSQQRSARISTTQQIATSPRLTVAQRIASAPPHLRRNLTAALGRIEKAYAHPGGITGPLSADQKAFAESLAHSSGMSPRLAAAATLREGGSGGRGGRDNWLNIGVEEGRTRAVANDPMFDNPRSAGKATAMWLRGQGTPSARDDVASPGIQNIGRVAARHGSDQQVGQAWAQSGWASSGASPLDTLSEVGSTPGKKPKPKDVHTLQRSGVSPPGQRKPPQPKESPAVQHETRLVRKGKLDKGPGSLVVGSGVDIKSGQEPEIAARLKLLSSKIGKPIYIISGHRTPAHSVAVGGFADDPHTQAKAADIGVGSAERASAGQLTSAQLASVGLVRPFGGAAEINHVQLADGSSASAPISGGGGGGAVTSSQVQSYAKATGMSLNGAAKVAKRNPALIRRKLARIEAAYAQSTPASTSSSGLTRSSRARGAPVV